MICKLFPEDCIAGFTKFSYHHPSGRIYRPEGVDSWILNLTREGGGLINPDSPAPFEVNPGDLLLFPPVIVHVTARQGLDSRLDRLSGDGTSAQPALLRSEGAGRSRSDPAVAGAVR